jgi:hypothetical protein
MKFLPRGFDEKEVAHLRQIVLPSGIGEFQWVMTKLTNIDEKIAVFGLDGSPRRLHQFAELHPNVEAFGYAEFDYSQVRNFQKFHGLESWDMVTRLFGPGQICMLACNPHLEEGKSLASWMPDLPTSYTYPIVTTEAMKTEADRTLFGATADDVLIGISCASYRGAEAWRTWGSVQWTDFLHKVQKEVPNAKFVLLGGSWDDLTSTVYDPTGPLRWQLDKRGMPPVGTTSFGGAVEVLKRLDGYIGFSSGLGHVAAHLCECPVFMMWPEHEQALSRSWVNPTLLESGFYVPSRWENPTTVFNRAKPWLQFISERKPAWR